MSLVQRRRCLFSTDAFAWTNKHYFGIGIHDGCVGRAGDLCDDVNREKCSGITHDTVCSSNTRLGVI